MTTTYWAFYWVSAVLLSFIANWLLRPKDAMGWQRNKIALFLSAFFLLFALVFITIRFIHIKSPEADITLVLWVFFIAVGIVLQQVSRILNRA